MKPKNIRMPTTIQVGFLIRAILCLSASSSTADASRAPAFLTYTAVASPSSITARLPDPVRLIPKGSIPGGRRLGELVRTCSSLVVILVL